MRTVTVRVQAFARPILLSLALYLSCGAAHAWHLEAGRVTLNNTATVTEFTTVTFQNPFPSVPVVVALPTNQGAQSSALRLRNVTRTGFEVAQLEPPGLDGTHISMTVDYIAAEVGQHILPSGEQVAVGLHSTTTTQSSTIVPGPRGYDLVNFGTTITGGSSVIAAIQTLNSETGNVPAASSTPWLTAGVLNAGADSVELALERSEVAAGVVLTEVIGYIAFPDGGAGNFTDTDGNTIDWSSMTSADVIVGFDNACVQVPFSGAVFSDAHVVATKATRDGGDGGWLRRCSINGTEIGLQVDEDTTNDAERAHTNERAGILAFSGAFHAFFGGELEANKTVSIVEGPSGEVSELFSIPGATAQYSIEISNVGIGSVDADSLILVDSIPSGVSLIVSDFGLLGSGPLSFSDDTPTSGLIYNFTTLADLTDNIDFSSNNGASFDYIPVPTANGTDPAVTHFRFRPSGSFRGADASITPAITIRYNTIIR